ncbi:histone-lysine N-methyltransferase SETMAR [Trichonephila clavipes]|nr:histone-lysine N-methyltransferase SETMAR [Trichonephila clavipes]
MDVLKELIRDCLLYDFKVGLSAAASSRRICQAFGDSAVNENYHLFHSQDNHLRGKSFTKEADVCQAHMDFFASHTPEYYRKGIEQLETRWKKVLDADSDYFEN